MIVVMLIAGYGIAKQVPFSATVPRALSLCAGRGETVHGFDIRVHRRDMPGTAASPAGANPGTKALTGPR
jgi:hypothetical protein